MRGVPPRHPTIVPLTTWYVAASVPVLVLFLPIDTFPVRDSSRHTLPLKPATYLAIPVRSKSGRGLGLHPPNFEGVRTFGL